MKTVFAVDDSDTNLSKVEEALEDDYMVMTLPSAEKMFGLLKKMQPDLILLDIEMPEMNGMEALKILKDNERYKNIPVMFLTGRTDFEVEVKGFELGAVDFVTKPFSAPVLQNRVRTHLDMDSIIRERTARIQLMQSGVVSVLSDLVERRDNTTGGHIERTGTYMRLLLDAMETFGVYADEVQGWDIDSLINSACLHDIGKIAVPDVVLNKPGKLTPEEMAIMRSHVREGEQIIDEISTKTGAEQFFRNARLFASAHHEKWDGTGYPRGLKEFEIPLQGRIMALVDVYDALVSERPYKKAFTDDEAAAVLLEGSGKHFDPALIELFANITDEFKAVSKDLCKL
jgi:putative two-component system response regulator